MSQVMNKWIIVVLYLLLPTTIPAQERGMFFEKKSYDHQPLPTYEQSKSQLLYLVAIPNG